MLPDSEERRRVELLETEAERGEALELYQRWIRKQTGQLERTPGMWTRMFDVQDHVVAGYRTANGELQGYVFALYRNDLPVRERYLEIDEIVWVTEAARRALFAWIASLADQWQQVVLRALPSHRRRLDP